MRMDHTRKPIQGGLRRMLCLLLAALLLLSAAAFSPPRATASSGPVKETKSRTISIVFDNSGSMYYGNNSQAWCRAIYAMEVFARMMNDGDTLMIYPMHEISVNGVIYRGRPISYDEKGKNIPAELNPLVIRSTADIPSIRDIYTPFNGSTGTPVATISYALEGLQGSSADEKWLILLTDGDSFHDRNGTALKQGPTKALLETELGTCVQSVNTLYLGIGVQEKYVPQVNPGASPYSYHASRAANSADVLRELNSMCNRIFGRDALPDVGKTVSFDIPISKLIVLAQGDSVDKVSLTSTSGAAGKLVSEHSLHYSTLGGGGDYADTFKVDETLKGVVVTYRDIPAGDYTLDCGGVTPTVYYEPDVDLAVMLLDENGNRVKAGDQYHPGTYRLVYGLVDDKGNFTDSKLLGNKEFTITYTINGTEYVIRDTKAGEKTIELGPDSNVSMLKARATYLSGYTIEKNAQVLGWPPDGFAITPRPVGVFDMKVSGGQDTYQPSELEEKAQYRITLYYEGSQLTGSALDAATLEAALEGGNLDYELKRVEDGYTLVLKHRGDPVETDIGKYTVRFSGTYTNEDGQTGPLNARNVTFEVIPKPVGSFEMKISGGESSYPLAELEEKGKYLITLYHEGEQLTGDALDSATLNAELSGGNLKYGLERTEEGYILQLKYHGTAVETDSGRYTFRFSGTYTNEDGQTGQLSAQDLRFTVEDPTELLTMTVDMPQNFYVISKIAEGEPFTVTLAKNRQPLTDAELAATTFTAEGEKGMKLRVEPLPGQSAYRVSIDPDSVSGSGFYKLRFHASTPDAVGRTLTAEDTDQVEMQNYPRWVRTVLILGIILLILLLIWLYLNAKVLPKGIMAAGNSIFTVDGSSIKGAPTCTYPKKSKKTTLDLTTPKYSPNPLIKGGVHMELEAVSPRRTKSSARKVKVVGITALNSNNVTSIKVGNVSFVKDEQTRKLVPLKGKPNAPLAFEFGTNAKVIITGEAMSENGTGESFSLSVNLKFK